jgi:septal ring factor EnvC (AmiA/AmiB activator)
MISGIRLRQERESAEMRRQIAELKAEAARTDGEARSRQLILSRYLLASYCYGFAL